MAFTLSSAVLWPNGKIYFFSQNEYYRYDIAKESVDPGYPLPIQGNWDGLGNDIQGAIVWPIPVDERQKAYFFSRNLYYRYDVASDQVDPGYPRPTNLNWAGVLPGSLSDYHIDSAILWPNGKVYLFQGDMYYRYDVTNDRVDLGYPELIQGNWPGLWSTGQPLVAAFVWPKLVNGRQKAYFFHHNLYMRYDIERNRLDPNYPLPIQGNWTGLL